MKFYSGTFLILLIIISTKLENSIHAAGKRRSKNRTPAKAVKN